MITFALSVALLSIRESRLPTTLGKATPISLVFFDPLLQSLMVIFLSLLLAVGFVFSAVFLLILLQLLQKSLIM